jgi:Zn-dependent protease
MDEREAERRLANLQAVARHHAARAEREQEQPAADKPSPWKRRLAALGPIGLLLLFVLGKGKFLLPILKLTKLSTLLTMVLAIWAYALFWGLPFAVGFVLLIFVHEMGHAIVLHRQGIRAGAPVFIPFVGAVIAMKGLPRNAWIEALVGIGGPVLGSLGALVCLVVAWLLDAPFWYALAHIGFFLNLINLLPVSPLDGGRIVGVISRWLWVAGYVVGIGAFFLTWSPLLMLILLVGLFNLGRAGYFAVEPAKRVTMAAAYFGLMAALAIGMWLADMPLAEWREQQSGTERDGGDLIETGGDPLRALDVLAVPAVGALDRPVGGDDQVVAVAGGGAGEQVGGQPARSTGGPRVVGEAPQRPLVDQ